MICLHSYLIKEWRFFFTYDAAVGKINFDKDIYQLIYSETFCLKDAKNINLENKLSPQMIIFKDIKLNINLILPITYICSAVTFEFKVAIVPFLSKILVYTESLYNKLRMRRKMK